MGRGKNFICCRKAEAKTLRYFRGAPDEFLLKTNERYLNDNILTTILKRHLRIF